MSQGVAFSSFEYLHNALINELLRTPAKAESNAEFQRGTDIVSWRYRKVEEMGFRVGGRLMAHCARGKDLKRDTLSTVKFICKDFWSYLFKKTIDKLQTNHRGVYVLHDFQFKLLQRLWPCGGKGGSATGVAETAEASTAAGTANAVRAGENETDAATADALLQREVRNHAAFTCGILRGAFAQLGERCTVELNRSSPPVAQFQVVLA
jgi:hypothetical protein